MTLAEFQAFVASRPAQFRGVHPLAASDFDAYEQRLGHPLPESLRWLRGTHGHSECCRVDNLAEAVDRTLACRESIGLARNWMLLNDWGDAGLVLLDMPTGRVCWCGAHDAVTSPAGRSTQTLTGSMGIRNGRRVASRLPSDGRARPAS